MKPGTSTPRTDPALEIGLIALLVFLPGLAAGFVYDDILLVRDNPYTHGFQHLGRAFSTHFWNLEHTETSSNLGNVYYRPLVTVSLIANWVMGRGQPWAFHLFNALLHAGCVFLMARVAVRWTGSLVLGSGVALIAALHPSRTESVLWIAGRSDLMMMLFVLLGIEFVHRGSRLAPARRAEKMAFLAASLGCLAIGILCKEAAAALPLLIAVEILSQGEKEVGAGDSTRERGRWFLVMFSSSALALAYVLVRVLVYPVRPGAQTELTPRYGLMTIAAYAERVLLPWPQTFFHRPLVAVHGVFQYPAPLVVAGALIAIAYLVSTISAFRRSRASGLMLLLAAASLGPLLNFTYTGIFVTTSDHMLYLPLFLFATGIATAYAEPLSKLAQRRGAQVGFLAVLLLWVGIDLLRARDYRDQGTLFRRELSINPNNPLALKSMSEVYAREGKLDQAFDLLLSAERPESTRYALLSPPWLLFGDYLRLLGLQAARTADGATADLRALYAELDRLLRLDPRASPQRIGALTIGRTIAPALLNDLGRTGPPAAVLADAALVATRLGKFNQARRFMAAIPFENMDRLPSPWNLVLARARTGDFKGARRTMSYLAIHMDTDERTRTDLTRRLRDSEALFSKARRAPDSVQSALDRAQGWVELGAYLMALRVLRPVYDDYPNYPRLAPEYVQLLLAARLEREALDVASRALGPEVAPQTLLRMRAGLPKSVLALRPVREPSEWYVGRRDPGSAVRAQQNHKPSRATGNSP